MDIEMTNIPRLQRERGALEIIVCAMMVYRRYFLLMISLSIIVTLVVNIIALVMGQTGTQPLSPLYAFDAALLAPLVAGYYSYAFAMIESKDIPRLGTVLSRGTRTLPSLMFAELVVVLGIGLGCLFLVVPGIWLAIRWSVVAPVISLEGNGPLGWLHSIGKSARLTRSHYPHILAVMLVVLAITAMISLIANAIVGTAGGVLAGTIGLLVQTINVSLGATVLTLLYFDLVSRQNEGQVAISY